MKEGIEYESKAITESVSTPYEGDISALVIEAIQEKLIDRILSCPVSGNTVEEWSVSEDLVMMPATEFRSG